MPILSANKKDIYFKKGDTGNIYFTSLPKDKAYNVYMSVYNPDTNTILQEFEATEFNQSVGEAYFAIDEDTSNSFPVGEWVYGLKICFNGQEDTVIPRVYIDEEGNLIKDNAPRFTVDYKYVEGD